MTRRTGRNPYEIQVNTKPRSTRTSVPYSSGRNPYEIQVNTKGKIDSGNAPISEAS